MNYSKWIRVRIIGSILVLLFFGTLFDELCIKVVIFIFNLSVIVKIALLSIELKDINYSSKISTSSLYKNLPIYSILIPLLREANMVNIIFAHIEKLNYPKYKLDILVILEEDDYETQEAFQLIDLPKYWSIVIAPSRGPKTKAKALNYGLNFVQGKYVVIYDAEDRPHPNQLIDAFQKFCILPKEYVCVQSTLLYFNYSENLLTFMFEIEYEILFQNVLPRLIYLNYPSPLGGTSNHFKVEIIKHLKWDIFNVTEDAEIGIRIQLCGYKIAKLNSVTLEEATVNILDWIKQRSRWIKGYMQTYIQHSSDIKTLCKIFGIDGMLIFFNIFLLPALNLCISPAIIAMNYIHSCQYNFLLLLSFSLYYCITLIIAYKAVYSKKINMRFCYILLYPLYTMIQIIPCFIAIWELIYKPHYWSKTPHGKSKLQKNMNFNNF
ncbi:MAG: glycosyltransferase [Proteobacteria bacterium]|nr:glycosyltransferase [Pseudomonadota bacterium]